MADQEILIPGEDKIIREIIKKKSDIQKARNIFEKQWLVNLAFLYGRSHFIAESKRISSGVEDRILWELKSEERKNKTKRSSNYILPLYRSMLARLLMMKANITVEPMTATDPDKSAARVAQEVLEDHWQMVNKANPVLCKKSGGMLRVLSKLFASVLSTGKGYLLPYFNPKTNSKAYLNEEVVPGEIGEAETKVLTPFDVFEDRLGMFTIIQETLPLKKIKEQYGVEVKADEMSTTDSEQELLSMLEGGGESPKVDDAAKVYHYIEIPTEDDPQGKYTIITASKVVYDGGIPQEYKGRVPLFEFDYLDLLMSTFPQSMIEQIISLQEEYNYTLSRLHAYKKWFAGKLKVPKKCKLETKYDDEIGQIIYYEQGFGEPHFETPPTSEAVNFLLGELARIRKDMEDIVGVHDSNMSPARNAGKSGVSIQNLNELDTSQLMPVLMAIETQLEFYCETVLDIIELKYSEPRILNITGENMGADVQTFTGQQVKGNRRIKVSLGSALPMSKSERQQFLMLLADKGYIERSKALELMEFADLAGVYISIDENAQKMEIGEMLKGVESVPQQLDYHPSHIKVIEDFLKGQQFKKLPPEIQQMFMNHYKIHQQYLTIESQTAMNMAGGGMQPQGQEQPNQPQGGQGNV
jgi:hypothetical protein